MFDLHNLEHQKFSFVPPEMNHKPVLSVKRFAKYIEENSTEDFKDFVLQNIDKLWEKFSSEEIAKLGYQFGTIQMANFSHRRARPDSQPIAQLITMIRYATESQTMQKIGWNDMVVLLNRLSQLRFDLGKEWTSKLTVSNSVSPGRLFLSDIYCDGSLAILLCYKGQPSVIIGLIPLIHNGILHMLIPQIQSARQKGNRGLFRLPPWDELSDFIIEMLSIQFPNLCLVDPESIRIKWMEVHAQEVCRERWLFLRDARQRFAKIYSIPRNFSKISMLTVNELKYQNIMKVSA